MPDMPEMPPVSPPEPPPVTAGPPPPAAGEPPLTGHGEAVRKAEPELTERELGEKIYKNWVETVKTVVSIFEVDPDEVARQLKKDGETHDDEAVKREVERRKKDSLYDELEKVTGLKEALAIRRQVNVTRRAADEAVEKAKKEAAASGGAVDEAAIRKRFIKYARGGVYYKLDGDGSPTGEEIHYSHANKPFIEALKVIAGETHQPDPQKDPELTERAKRARELYDFFSGRLVESGDGGHFIDSTVKKDALKAREIEKTIEKTRDLTVDTLDALLGDYRKIRKKDGSLDLEAILKTAEKLDPTGRLGRVAILLVYYEENPTNPEARGFLSALMYQELNGLLTSDAAKQYPALVQRLRELYGLESNTQFFKEQLGELSKRLIRLAGYDPDRFKLSTENLTRDILFALLCEDHVEMDLQTREFKPKAKDIDVTINHWIAQGQADAAERTLILTLAGEKRASAIFSVLGINTEELKGKDSIRAITKKAVDRVSKRRELLGKEFKTDERGDYENILDSLIKQNAEKYAEKRGFPKGLGYGLMLLLIFAPSIQGLLGIGLGGEEERQQG